MTPTEFWFLVLAAAGPIAAVVGFGVQVHLLRKTRLENEKLALEIKDLKAKQDAKASRIVVATLTETIKYSHQHDSDFPKFSRSRVPSEDDLKIAAAEARQQPTRLGLIVAVLFVVCFSSSLGLLVWKWLP